MFPAVGVKPQGYSLKPFWQSGNEFEDSYLQRRFTFNGQEDLKQIPMEIEDLFDKQNLGVESHNQHRFTFSIEPQQVDQFIPGKKIYLENLHLYDFKEDPLIQFQDNRNQLFQAAYKETYKQDIHNQQQSCKKIIPEFTETQENKENMFIYKNITPEKNFSFSSTKSKNSQYKSANRSPFTDITPKEEDKKRKSQVHLLLKKCGTPSIFDYSSGKSDISLFR